MEGAREYWKNYADEKWGINGIDASAQTGNNKCNDALFYIRVDEIRRDLYLNSDSRVLDLGGGVGWIAYCMADLVNKWTLVDFSHNSVELARQILPFPNIEVIESDFMDYQIDCEPNRVLMAGALLYLENMEAVKEIIKKVYDALPPGGIALFTQNPADNFKFIALKGSTIEHILWFNIADMKEYCVNIGFRMVDIGKSDRRIWFESYMFKLRCMK